MSNQQQMWDDVKKKSSFKYMYGKHSLPREGQLLARDAKNTEYPNKKTKKASEEWQV